MAYDEQETLELERSWVGQDTTAPARSETFPGIICICHPRCHHSRARSRAVVVQRRGDLATPFQIIAAGKMAVRYEASVYDTQDHQRQQQQTSHHSEIRRSSVSFQPKLSFYSDSGGSEWYLQDELPENDEVKEETFHWWQWLMENRKARQAFRLISLANLIVLLLSIPFWSVNSAEISNENELRYQFIVITCLDGVLAILYTFQLAVRIRYFLLQNDSLYSLLANYGDHIRLISLFGLTLSMWFSVGIGVYRSLYVQIFWAYYIGFMPRAFLSVTSVIKLLVPSKVVDSSVWRQVSTILKWKQLYMVTVFYFIFLLLFALLGVHLIGGLNYICLYQNSTQRVPAVPITHCTPENSLGQIYCPAANTSDESIEIICGKFPSDDIGINYRVNVYYGQFRTILDALYAIYEASTLELWSFMMNTAINGRSNSVIPLFYVFLILFLVIILQQSIFLVVIIESFADLRSQSSTSLTQPEQPSKPATVLVLESGSTEASLQLKSKEERSPQDFLQKYCKLLTRMEKIFLVLVLLDAIITSLKMADYSQDTKNNWKLVLQIWQMTASVAFLIEVIILFLFHLYHGQWKLFFKRPYYLCLCVLAIGGVVAAVPKRHFYNPLYPSNGLVLFQSFRFPRLIRISRHLQTFFLKLMGNLRIPLLIVITLAIIAFLSIVNAQIFAYKKSRCGDVGSGHYSNILNAFVATFQLVMNEAWTDVTSELMCGTNYEWLVTNLYFIVIHLFSSLIFLNFFGAIILDNLEYDEEEKQAKLEDVKNKEAKPKTVPLHLRIFKKLKNQPKRLRPPGNGLPDPNLEEIEVRRFFESATVPSSANIDFQDYVTPPISNQRPDPSPDVSQLRQLSLVSTEGVNMFPFDTTPALERKYQSISALLKFVKLWRQQAEKDSTTTTATRSSQFPYLFGSSSRTQNSDDKKRSEFDEYREKHRCFDRALFWMSPQHKFRRFCTFLLTAQAETPKYELIQASSHKILELFKKRVMFGVTWLVSQMSYFTWLMFIGLWGTQIVQFIELTFQLGQKEHYQYFIISEVVYVTLMLSWLLIRVLSKGLFLNPDAAINSLWDILDWILLIDSTLLLVLVPVWTEGSSTSISKATVKIDSYASLHLWVQIMFVIRALRFLHIISLFHKLRDVVKELIEGWRNLIIGTIFMFGFVFMFASLGVQLFAGTDENPLGYCNDPSVTSRDDCYGEFYIFLRTSREYLRVPDIIGEESMLVPRVWFPHARDYPFNNIWNAMLTLFELLTLEGWSEVRDLFNEKPGNESSKWYMGFYMHIYVFFAVNLGLQLFLGIVVNNFNEHKPDHRFLLSVDQNRWLELMQRISLQRPYKLPPEPRNNIIRLKLYKVLTYGHYRIVPTVFTVLSVLTLVVPWKHSYNFNIDAIIALNILFNFYTIFEVIIKLLAFGPTYFHSWRNMFDLILSVVTIVYYAFAVVYFSGRSDLLLALSYTALSIVICKCLTVLVKYSAMLNLLITVVTTIGRTIPLLQVLSVIIFCYSFVGVILFGELRKGEALLYSLVNFSGVTQSLFLVFRSLTGEDWYQIMWDLAVRVPYGLTESASAVKFIISVMYFGSFIILVPFILINVFIAVLLENFSIFYNDDDTNLSLTVIKDFRKKWRHFDIDANGHIKLNRVKLLLRSLELQEFYSYTLGELRNEQVTRETRNLTNDSLLLWEMEEELRREVALPGNKATLTQQSPGETNVAFPTVLRMLAYRCENIHTRLEPHELYTREELETTIQIDVAEMCILRWLRKNVKPLIETQSSTESVDLPQQQQQPKESTAQNRQFQLLALHNMQSQFLSTCTSWNKQPSLDAEDEEGQMDSQRFSRLFSNTVTNPEEHIDTSSQDDAILARTYAKMTQNRSQEMIEGRERAKEWFRMQQEWMDHVGKNPNYFDDGL